MKTLFCALMLMATLSHAQETQIPLYPDGVPNSKPTPADYVENDADLHAAKVSIPTLTPFFPEKGTANGTAVIICPGGSYINLSIDKEGYAVAKEFNKIGVTAFVLKYRLPSDAIMVDKTIGPLQDAQMAILIIRTRAKEWGINPSKIGIMGFSAGGHLASTTGTHFDKPVITRKDTTSVRPDFMMLMYPVITFGDQAHKGSKNNLLGLTPTPEMIALYSNENQVSANTPLTFIVQAEDDKTVPIQNSLLFYEALLKAKVPVEMHLYQAGGHGFGLNNPKSKEKWFDWCKSWMDENGLLAQQ
jgi:acetyl esterase/lipase